MFLHQVSEIPQNGKHDSLQGRLQQTIPERPRIIFTSVPLEVFSGLETKNLIFPHFVTSHSFLLMGHRVSEG